MIPYDLIKSLSTICRKQVRADDMIVTFVKSCSTGQQPLDNGRSAFERGGVDVCKFDAPDVASVNRVALATDLGHPGVEFITLL